MRLKKLTLQDYRGFRALDLELDPSVTVLVGVNGAGKTSLLDAIAMMLTHITAGVTTGELDRGTTLASSDIRVDASGARVTVSAAVGAAEPTWLVAAGRPGHPGDWTSDPLSLRPAVDAARASIAAGVPRLPLAVYFPTNRSALDIPARIRTPHEFDALSAYDGALEGGASNFRGFFEWFRQEEDLYNEQQVIDLYAEGQPAFESQLPHVRRAIEALVPDATGLRIERRPQRMTLLRKGVRLDVGQLSDGEKCLLALAGDLARRMVLAAPGEEDPLSQSAVVLIDEVELHLHPGLQRRVVPLLRKVFHKAQFVVTTHSPQVLSSVHAASVRVLDAFQVRPLERGTWRRDTNQILETAFDDPGRPPEVAEKLSALRDAVDEDRVADARALIRELRGMMEGSDPDVVFLEQLLPPEEGPEAHA